MKEAMVYELKLFLKKCHGQKGEIPVFLNGRLSSPEEIVEIMVYERGHYTFMADLLRDEDDKICAVNYNPIRLKDVM